MMRRVSLALLSLLVFGNSAHTWTWPNAKLDALDDIYTIVSGSGKSGLIDGVNPCGFPPGNQRDTGRQAAAEWVRVAYHDMSTHNVDDGTGGVDSSIGWETDRPENIGTAMNTTLQFFRPFTNKFISMSDVIALGTIFSVKICRGPSIPFRTGRIDASGPGPSGVPEPHQDLKSHTESFRRQGFNQADMIGLVACGHTMGGVHEVDFPQTVTAVINTTNTEGMVHFDDTFDTFDNHVATQWVKNTTTNPLAVGKNATTNSDARIFASDGNSTIRALASDNAGFVSSCGTLLARMLDTVPSSVQLSEPLEPLPVKPWNMQLSLDYEGQLRIAGYIRIFDNGDPYTWSAGSMPVDFIWKDRTGASNENNTLRTRFLGLYSTSFWGNVALFPFNQTITPASGISNFVVDYARSANGTMTRADNGGTGFPVQDVVMMQPVSCVTNTNTVNVVAAVRNSVNPVRAYVDYSYRVSQPGSLVPKYVDARVPLIHSGASTSKFYTLYKASFDVPETFGATLDLTVEAGGKTYKDEARKVPFTSC